MKILVINGSPKGNRSNSYKLTQAFLEGFQASSGGAEIKELQVNRMDIKPCLGCFSCWNKTPGKCCIQDNMSGVIEDMLWADLTVWSFPLYYFTVPGALKNLIDRQLPMVLPFMVERPDSLGSGSHPSRYDMSGKRNVIISTCGFYSAEGNYDGVLSLFDHMCGKGNYETIFCGQGELFRVPELNGRTGEYLGCVRQAGEEYAKGGISRETRNKLKQLLYPKDVFESMADASWGVDKETGEKESDALIFTKQMSMLYNKGSWSGKDLVFDMFYTDIGERYQIVLGKDRAKVLTDCPNTPDTVIETPLTVWRSIAAGEIRGDEALMQHMYKVKGDFNLMLKWDSYFGDPAPEAVDGEGESPVKSQASIHDPKKPTNMLILLLPWMGLWIAASIDAYTGSLISIALCALVPLIFMQNRKTFYDYLSFFLVTGFALALIMGGPSGIIIPLSYLAFGIMWSLSCLAKIPLTAHYSMNSYGGEAALKNTLFIKTNRILTLLWGILYLLTPIWTYFIMKTDIGGWVGAINSILPIFMGLFTAWFQHWYPAKVARG